MPLLLLLTSIYKEKVARGVFIDQSSLSVPSQIIEQDPPEIYVKTQGRQGGNCRWSEWNRQWQIMPD